jgi:ribonuclease T2
LPRLNLQPATKDRLNQAMPGTASALERHEWLRHGSCFGSDPDTYFRTALSLLEQVNQSKLRDTLAIRLGETVTVRELITAFEASFGKGTGQALGVRCTRDGQRQLISEIRIKLKQPLYDTTPLKDALDLSSPAFDNCDAGVVDRVGLE